MAQDAPHNWRPERASYDQIALVLQGGGALGAYQAGVYQALFEAGIAPDWIAGISIGAINAAIICGNPPDQRIEKLRAFWYEVTSTYSLPAPPVQEVRTFFNARIAALVATIGVPGFFMPRVPPAFLVPQGFPEAISVYDTSPLRKTLERFVDFDLINKKVTRLSVGTVNIRTGNFVYFDNMHDRIGPEHIMASAALPPGLPPIQIGDDLYWDGGVVSNTPLTQILDSGPEKDTLVFQVDLFSAKGEVPRDLFEVEERRKDISYSSRTRLNTDMFRRTYQLREAIGKLLEELPEERRNDPDVKKFEPLADGHRVSIVHLIYRRRAYEEHSMDYEFSRASMLDHWQSGYADARRTLAFPAWNEPDSANSGIRVFDMTREDDVKYKAKKEGVPS